MRKPEVFPGLNLLPLRHPVKSPDYIHARLEH